MPPYTRTAAASESGSVAPAGVGPIQVDESLMATMKTGLNRVAAPFRRSLGEADEKIAIRTVELKKLQVHTDEETLPKAIILPRMPQCPTSQRELFEESFKSLTERFGKDALKLLMQVKRLDIINLKEERASSLTELKQKLRKALDHAHTVMADAPVIQLQLIADKYMASFLDQLDKDKIRNEAKSAFNAFFAQEKKNSFLLKKAAEDIDEVTAPAPQGVDRLRQEMRLLRKEVESMRKGKEVLSPSSVKPKTSKSKPSRKKGEGGNQRQNKPNHPKKEQPKKRQPRKAPPSKKGQGAGRGATRN